MLQRAAPRSVRPDVLFPAWSRAGNTKGSDRWGQNRKLQAQNTEIPVLLTSLERSLGAKRPCSLCHSNSSSCWVSLCSAPERGCCAVGRAGCAGSCQQGCCYPPGWAGCTQILLLTWSWSRTETREPSSTLCSCGLTAVGSAGCRRAEVALCLKGASLEVESAGAGN